MLEEWYRVVRPGGNILIITPNFAYIAHGYVEGWMDYTESRSRMFGGQDYPGNFHSTMFDSPSMGKTLEKAGFKNVQDVTSSYENRKVPMSIYFNAEK